MKIRRAFLKGSVLAMAAAVAGGALWVGPTPAQTAVQSTTTSVLTTTVQRAWSSSLVSVRGIVSGSPESVAFSGTAKVATRLAPDPDFGSPSLVISIDLTGVSGVGSSTGTKYVISGPEIVQKQLTATHVIDITFPFYRSGTMGTSGARSGAASFAVDVDLATGAVTNATGSIGSSSL